MHKLRGLLKYRLVPAIVLFIVFAVSSTLLSSFTEASINTQPPESDTSVQNQDIPPPEQVSYASGKSETPTPDADTLPRITLPALDPPPFEPPVVSPPITEPVGTHFINASGEPIKYDYGEPIPESEPADDEYFADTVFVGDSRTEGFKLYSGLKTADIFAAKCISVDNIYSENAVLSSHGEYVPIIDALSWQTYSKVYIMLGINELGYDIETFIGLYSRLIDNIRELQPDADIYLQAIIPVSKHKDENNPIYTNERICSFNEALSVLASEKELFFIDTYSALCNEDGCLPEDASFDGVHLIKDYCIQWLEYLRTHTAVSAGGDNSDTDHIQICAPDIETGGLSDINIYGR